MNESDERMITCCFILSAFIAEDPSISLEDEEGLQDDKSMTNEQVIIEKNLKNLIEDIFW
jgi:hypothetical protein